MQGHMTKITKIDYHKTKEFWDLRAKACQNADLESITLLEELPELAEYKNQAEKRHILKLLKSMRLEPHMVALDLGCGTGRWSFELAKSCAKVIAVDYSSELLKIANEEANRREIKNVEFHQASAVDFLCPEKFDLILIAGLLLYISDDDILELIKKIRTMLKPKSILILREPTAVKGRLERINRYDANLKASYSAIYRSFDEHIKLFTQIGGFKLTYTNFVYPPFLIPLFLYNHFLPSRLKFHQSVKNALRAALKLNLVIDPFLLRLKPIYEILIRLRGIEIAQRIYVYKPN